MSIMLLQTCGALLLIGASCWGGWLIAGLKNRWWAAGYSAGLLLLIMIAIPNYVFRTLFLWPFTWLTYGRFEFALMGVGASLLVMTCIRKSPKQSYKILLAILLAAGLSIYVVGPFIMPLLLISKHRALVTKIVDDNCMQSTEYTCGPAAAVTGLLALGIKAEEGTLAIACATTATAGTQPDSLCNGITELYGKQGITCDYKWFGTIDELATAQGPVLAIIKFSFLVDHYICVFNVNDGIVYVGDPIKGRRGYTYEEFYEVWKRTGVEVRNTGDRGRRMED